MVLEIGNKTPSRKVLFLSIATAIMIASYTVIDGVGVRLSGNSVSFMLWLSLFQSIIFSAIILKIKSSKQCFWHFKKFWKKGIISAILSMSAYTMVLYAITKAPIAYVSALRETSVLFASLIAFIFLSEPLKPIRILSSILIICGIAIIKIG